MTEIERLKKDMEKMCQVMIGAPYATELFPTLEAATFVLTADGASASKPVIGRNRLDRPVPIARGKDGDGYSAVADFIERELGIRDTCIVRIWTTNCGADNEILMWDSMDYYWDNDWDEGGDIVLLGVVRLCDLAF